MYVSFSKYFKTHNIQIIFFFFYLAFFNNCSSIIILKPKLFISYNFVEINNYSYNRNNNNYYYNYNLFND